MSIKKKPYPKFVVDTIIKNRKKLSKINDRYMSWSKKGIIRQYFNGKTLTTDGQQILDEFAPLEDLFIQMDCVKGVTAGGRDFKLTLNDEFVLDIYNEKGEIYRPFINISDIFQKNILSFVNKADDLYFNNRIIFNKKIRNIIEVDCTYDFEPMKVILSITNVDVILNLKYDDNTYTNHMYTEIDKHIPYEQRCQFVVAFYSSNKNVTEIIKAEISRLFNTCCGSDAGRNNFCPKCGSKFGLDDFKVNSINKRELETLLT